MRAFQQLCAIVLIAFTGTAYGFACDNSWPTRPGITSEHPNPLLTANLCLTRTATRTDSGDLKVWMTARAVFNPVGLGRTPGERRLQVMLSLEKDEVAGIAHHEGATISPSDFGSVVYSGTTRPLASSAFAFSIPRSVINDGGGGLIARATFTASDGSRITTPAAHIVYGTFAGGKQAPEPVQMPEAEAAGDSESSWVVVDISDCTTHTGRDHCVIWAKVEGPDPSERFTGMVQVSGDASLHSSADVSARKYVFASSTSTSINVWRNGDSGLARLSLRHNDIGGGEKVFVNLLWTGPLPDKSETFAGIGGADVEGWGPPDPASEREEEGASASVGAVGMDTATTNVECSAGCTDGVLDITRGEIKTITLKGTITGGTTNSAWLEVGESSQLLSIVGEVVKQRTHALGGLGLVEHTFRIEADRNAALGVISDAITLTFTPEGFDAATASIDVRVHEFAEVKGEIKYVPEEISAGGTKSKMIISLDPPVVDGRSVTVALTAGLASDNFFDNISVSPATITFSCAGGTVNQTDCSNTKVVEVDVSGIQQIDERPVGSVVGTVRMSVSGGRYVATMAVVSIRAPVPPACGSEKDDGVSRCTFADNIATSITHASAAGYITGDIFTNQAGWARAIGSNRYRTSLVFTCTDEDGCADADPTYGAATPGNLYQLGVNCPHTQAMRVSSKMEAGDSEAVILNGRKDKGFIPHAVDCFGISSGRFTLRAITTLHRDQPVGSP